MRSAAPWDGAELLQTKGFGKALWCEGVPGQHSSKAMRDLLAASGVGQDKRLDLSYPILRRIPPASPLPRQRPIQRGGAVWQHPGVSTDRTTQAWQLGRTRQALAEREIGQAAKSRRNHVLMRKYWGDRL